MGKTVQKAPGADGLRRLWTWAKQCKKHHLEQMAYAACGHGSSAGAEILRWGGNPPLGLSRNGEPRYSLAVLVEAGVANKGCQPSIDRSRGKTDTDERRLVEEENTVAVHSAHF